LTTGTSLLGPAVLCCMERELHLDTLSPLLLLVVVLVLQARV
jgi:hypothetical protein